MSDIMIAPDGAIRFVHDDGLTEQMAHAGDVTIRRASFVEPASIPAGTKLYLLRRLIDPEFHDSRLLWRITKAPCVAWTADLSPAGGPKLGPFASRALALSEERLWLDEHDIPVCVPCSDGGL